MPGGEATTATPLPTRTAAIAIRIVIGVSLVIPVLVVTGNYLNRKDVQERPLQAGEAVSVKNVSKGWRPGYVDTIGANGRIQVRMGATREAAAQPGTDVLTLEGSGRLKRRKDGSE
ncbi:MAG: hypothetical protein V4542_03515 [Pseudomonadota bacterium]